jgi:hypothetical protein
MKPPSNLAAVLLKFEPSISQVQFQSAVAIKRLPGKYSYFSHLSGNTKSGDNFDTGEKCEAILLRIFITA